MSERLKRKNDQQNTPTIEKKPRIGGGGGRRAGEGSGDPTGVTFNPVERSGTLYLSRDQRTATCTKGYRMVKATHGVSNGKWYCEFLVSPDMKPGAHVRLGWANERADVHGPVGFDQHSYAYRDENGSRVHQSIRSSYGQSYGPGDVIGCLINFETTEEDIQKAEKKDDGASVGPADGLRQLKARELATVSSTTRSMIEQILYSKEPAQEYPSAPSHSIDDPSSSSSLSSSGSQAPPNTKHVVNQRYWNSSVQFFLNGVDQGIAFIHLTKEGSYYPAVSLYMGAAVRFNPGPNFTFPLPASLMNDGTTNGTGKIRPVSDLERMAFGSSLGHYSSLPNGTGTRPSSSTVIDIAANLQLLQRGNGPPTSLDIPYNFTGTQFAYTANTNGSSSSSNSNSGSTNETTGTATNRRKTGTSSSNNNTNTTTLSSSSHSNGSTSLEIPLKGRKV